MVLMDVPGGAAGYAPTPDYSIPATHILAAGRAVVLTYIAKPGVPTALIRKLVLDEDVVAPVMYEFSGRGPFPGANGAVMKPDVTAPGRQGCR